MEKIVLKVPTEEKRMELDRYQIDCHRIEFVMDEFGNWFCGKQNLYNQAFAAIHGELAKMSEIAFIPKLNLAEVNVVDSGDLTLTKE